MNKLFVALVGCTLAGTAMAEIKTYEGPGGDIPDLSTSRFEIFVPDHGPSNLLNATLGMEHSWVGDLIITLTHKTATGGVSARLLNRPGYDGSGFGNSDGIQGTYVFADGGMPFPTQGGSGQVEPGTYAPVDSLHIFDGMDKFGTWSLVISDNAGDDEGLLYGWSITLDNIPAPSSAALLGLGGLVIGRRRR